MYTITAIPHKGDERELVRSQNYRLAKRKARWIAAADHNLWFGKFLLYEDDVLIEEGAIIKARISWRIKNAKNN